jgi:hypothetical protein
MGVLCSSEVVVTLAVNIADTVFASVFSKTDSDGKRYAIIKSIKRLF